MDYRTFVELKRHVKGVLDMVDVAARPRRANNDGMNSLQYDSLLRATIQTWLKIYPDSPIKKIEGIG